MNDTGGLERFAPRPRQKPRSPGTCEDRPMDLGLVDRITADAVGEPGLARLLPPGAQRGGGRHRHRREGAGAAARRVGAGAARRLGIETGGGPARRRMELEQPFEPRWRAGRLSIGYEEERICFLLEIEEFQPEVEEDDPGRSCSRETPSCSGCGRRGSRCWPCRDTRPRWPIGPPDVPVLRQPLDPEGHSCPAMNGHSQADRLSDPGDPRGARHAASSSSSA